LVKFSNNGVIILGLGSNLRGRWGTPRESLVRACDKLEDAGLKIVCSSRLYVTEAVGSGLQAPYLNAVVVASGAIAPGSLLQLLKRIERGAGRKSTPPMQPRPLDIDVLDYAGRRVNWPNVRRERGRLVLPHPLLHTRAFVLVPLLEVAPRWVHPVLGRPGRTLLARLGPKGRKGIRGALDFRLRACDKAVR
jgi:2-amino-4-hydroxy-6-hydroxymethyldihydropteridine diphosphokinase